MMISAISYEVSFLSMVLPQDRLSTKLSHIGMINGKKIIKVETVNQNGTKVKYFDPCRFRCSNVPSVTNA